MKTNKFATTIGACAGRGEWGYVPISLKLNNYEGLLYLNYNVNRENQWLIICVGGDNDLEGILR